VSIWNIKGDISLSSSFSLLASNSYISSISQETISRGQDEKRLSEVEQTLEPFSSSLSMVKATLKGMLPKPFREK
jgi:hypothetical protein